MTSGPQVYGLLLCTASVGAALASVARPYAKRVLSPDQFVAAGTIAIAAALSLLGLCRSPAFAFTAAFIAGAGWTSVLASLSVSAQVALPDWVRGRGLAIFLSVVFGSMTLGSFVWGSTAAHLGLPAAHFLAAAGAVAAIPLTWRWHVQTAEGIDLSPSMHWQAPILARAVEDDSGPVLITVRYCIAGDDPDPFSTQSNPLGDSGVAMAPMLGEYSPMSRVGGCIWKRFCSAVGLRRAICASVSQKRTKPTKTPSSVSSPNRRASR